MEQREVTKGEIIISYELLNSGIDKAYNLQDCKVYYGVEKQIGPKLCSAQIFDSFVTARDYGNQLFDYASPRTLKLVGITKHGEGGIVFVEHVLPLKTWIDSTGKNDMWRMRLGKLLGVGVSVKIIFQQLLACLKYLHDNVKKAHNNLQCGVYTTLDKKRVMLGNFFISDKMSTKSKKGDFKAIKDIFESSIKTDYPGGSYTRDNVTTEVHEVKLFIQMLEKALKTDKSFNACCEFLYNPFIFWGPKVKRLFYDEFAYALKQNLDFQVIDEDTCPYIEHDWDKRIQSNTVWENIYNFQPSSYYQYTFGPMVLIRHLDHHRPIDLENVFDVAETLFPEALGAGVHSLLFGKFGSTALNPLYNPATASGRIQPQKIARDYILKDLLCVLEYQPF